MGKNGKTLEISWWLQLSKRQILSVLPVVHFAMRRPGVRTPAAPPELFSFQLFTRSLRRLGISRRPICDQLFPSEVEISFRIGYPKKQPPRLLSICVLIA